MTTVANGSGVEEGSGSRLQLWSEERKGWCSSKVVSFILFQDNFLTNEVAECGSPQRFMSSMQYFPMISQIKIPSNFS